MNYADCISIVVPVYNGEKYIGKCIKSIQKQTYPNWKLILVDDGSTDNTAEICDSFAAGDGRISVVHQENNGLIKARLTGLANASSEFLAFVDADDLIEPDMLQKLLDVQLQYSADIVCCRYKTLSRNGWIKRSYFKVDDSVTITSGKEEAVCIASASAHFTMWGKLYRRSVFLEAQEILEKLPNIFWCEDSLINTAVFSKADRVVRICEELYDYRIGGSSSNFSEKTMQEMVEVYRWRKNYLLNVKADIKYHKANLSQILDVVVYSAYNSKRLLSRKKICLGLAYVIADIEHVFPNYWHKDAFDLNIPMTDKEFKNIYHESPLVAIKQRLLRIL